MRLPRPVILSRLNALLGLFALVVLVPVGHTVELTPEEREFINQHPTIVVGGEMDWPPMDFVKDGVYTGAAKDYLDRIEQISGLKFNVVTGYSWSELLEMLENREVDMVPMMYWTNSRGATFNMTNPYITVRHYAFTKGDRGFSSLSDLVGMTIAVPMGYAHIEYLEKNHPDIILLEVRTVLDAIDAVVTGQADAVIENTASVGYFAAEHNIIGLEPAFSIQFEVNNVHMAVRKDWPILRSILQKSLNSIPTEETAAIMAKWTGSEATARTFLTSTVEFTEDENRFLQQQSGLSACVQSSLLPLESMSSFEHRGMTSEYMTIVSDALHLPVTPVPVNGWLDTQAKLRSGRCDLSTFHVAIADEHPEIIRTEALITEMLALVTRSDAAFIENMKNMSDVAIAVVDGFVDVKKLEDRYPNIQFVTLDTREEAYQGLSTGRYFGALDFVLTASHYVARNNQGSLKISAVLSEDSVSIGFAVSNSRPALAPIIQKVIASIPESQHQVIHNKWVAIKIEDRIDYKLFLQLLVVISMIMVFILFRFSEVRKHKEAMRQKNDELEKINRKLEQQKHSAMHLAYHDQLTGLSNRTKMMMDLQQSIKMCRRLEGKLALLFLDLDRFKLVNDSLGHDVGDKLLAAVAKRIGGLLRETDYLCRIGGDEFIVVLEGINDEYSPSIVAQRIIESLSREFRIDGQLMNIGTSIGISVYPDDTDEVNTMIKYADSAMYAAKEGGRNAFRYYHADLSTKASRRIMIESALRRALEEQNFSLALQPIVDLKQGKVVKAESLIRWNHPVAGQISPEEFIPIAEEYGLIVEIGEWVLRQSCEILSTLETMGCPLDSMAINVSSVEFLKGDIAGRFQEIVSNSGVDAEKIEIEITERYMLDRCETIEAELQRLRGLGHRISVDDFGTGYSSLSYMKRLPLNIIKIDRSFIQNIPKDSNDVEISQAIISLSHALGYSVVAEGVETEEQMQFLLQRGCDFAQGYFFSEPVAIEEFVDAVDRVNKQLKTMKNHIVSISPLRA